MDLTAFGKAVQERDTLKHAAYVDELTGMPNRLSCDLVFQMYGGESAKIDHVACALITISNLSATNIALGRDAGDQILIDFCNILEEVGDDYGFVEEMAVMSSYWSLKIAQGNIWNPSSNNWIHV